MALQLLDGDRTVDVKDSDLENVSGGDPDTVYTYRQIPPSVNRQLSKKHTKSVINARTRQRESEIDTIALLDDLFDYALVNWKGMLDKGVEAPCTTENKLRVDNQRKEAILTLAGLNQRAAEGRDESFRST